MDVRDSANLPDLWLKAAKNHQLNTQEKGELFKETKLVINEMTCDPVIAFELSSKIAETFQNFKPEECQSICNLVATLGERGTRKINKLFKSVLSSQKNPVTIDKKAITLENTPSTHIPPLSSWIEELQKNIQNKLQASSIKSNPETLLPYEVINYMKSNYLDTNSIYQLNVTTKQLTPSTKFLSEISREEIIRKDLIMLINAGKISLKSLGIYTLQELIDYLKEDIKLVTRIELCSERGLVENRLQTLENTEVIEREFKVTCSLFNQVLDHFPNLRELIIIDPLSTDLAKLLTQNKLAERLKKIPNLEKLNLNCGQLKNIDFLNQFPKLTHVELNECKSLGTIDTKKYFSKITHLELTECFNIKGLETLSQLEELNLRWIENVKSLDLSKLEKLIHLNIYYCPILTQIIGLEHLINLQELRIFKERPHSLQNPDTQPLDFTSLVNLEVLSLDGYSAKLEGLSKLKSLNQLFLTDCASLSDYSFLNELTNLNILQINSLRDKYTRHIALLKNLMYLDLKGSSISTIDFLKNLKNLICINFSGCQRIKNLEPLKHLSSLLFLNLDFCSNIKDISPLSRLPLKELMLMGIPFITTLKKNIKVFKTIPTLRTLDLSDQCLVDTECLAFHPALKKVYLRKNQIRKQDALLKISSLKHLTIQQTDCSKEIIQELEKKGVKVYKNHINTIPPIPF